MSGASRQRELHLALVLVMVVGAVLRFSWNSDMEYKGDEHWMFERSQAVGRTEPWPELGMPSGAGLRNPGMSVWVFVVLARVGLANTPLELDRRVVALNVFAFGLLLLFIYRLAEPEDREAWLWAGALAAVNPLALLLERKIWAQSVLPTFCVLLLMGWWRRDRFWGAALWGLVGALVGQVHMSGFFFAAALALWTLLFTQQRFGRKRTRWFGWLVGSVLGSVTLLPWVRYALSGVDAGPGWSLSTVLDLHFPRYVFSDALGLGLDYSLGGNYLDFMRSPHLLGDDLYPAMYLHGLALALGLVVLLGGLQFLWAARARWRLLPQALGQAREAVFLTFGALPVYGLLLTLSGVLIHRHYLIITFPFEWLALALLALRFAPNPRALLGGLVVVQLSLSVTFLQYIHDHHGAPAGDYGRAYRGN